MTSKATLGSKEASEYVDKTMAREDGIFYFWEPQKYLLTGQRIQRFTYLIDLWIEPEYRKRKIASSLLSTFTGPVILQCLRRNPARKFYEKQNFVHLLNALESDTVWLYRGDKESEPLAKILARSINVMQKKRCQ